MKHWAQPLVNLVEKISAGKRSRRKQVKLALARRVIILLNRFYDPLVTLDFGSTRIVASLSHDAVFWRVVHPQMNRNFGRLAAFAVAERPTGTIIDVGANIGDGIALLRGVGISADVFAVEGSPKFLRVLQQNKAKLEPVTIYPQFVGDYPRFVGDGRVEQYQLVSFTSSAHLRPSPDGDVSGTTLRPLDEAAAHLSSVSVLKVDTDGFDFAILRGAAGIIDRDRPVIFLEWEPYLIFRSGESIVDFLRSFRHRGYRDAIVWDNLGTLLCSISLDDVELFSQLSFYFFGDETRPYVDLAIYHEQDGELFKKTLDAEIKHFQAILRNEGVLS
ncbi:MAG: FkbM family methyltransferase [Steroidobacteraceae bacterium]|jgi:FkbM family methyltransferase